MSRLNYEFLDEYKRLDNICRDIYGETPDKKLGVTLYIEDMDAKANLGAYKVPGWANDYNRLKSIRNMRNELVHSRNSITVNLCSVEDIEFIRSFIVRMFNQTDPIAMLRKQTDQPHSSSYSSQPARQPRPNNNYTVPRNASAGCLGVVALFVVAFACVIAFLL